MFFSNFLYVRNGLLQNKPASGIPCLSRLGFVMNCYYHVTTITSVALTREIAVATHNISNHVLTILIAPARILLHCQDDN